MRLLFGFFALLIISTALKGTEWKVMAQLKKDFTGSGNFVFWIASLALVGAIGAIPEFQKVSKAIAAIIILVFVLANKGLFAKLQDALKNLQWPSSSDVIEGQATVIDPASIGTIGDSQAQDLSQQGIPEMAQKGGDIGNWARNLPSILSLK